MNRLKKKNRLKEIRQKMKLIKLLKSFLIKMIWRKVQ